MLWWSKSSNPDGSACYSQDVRNSPSFQCSIDHGHHVVELHASRHAETGAFVTFIYEKGSERLLQHITGTNENEAIRQAMEWCEKLTVADSFCVAPCERIAPFFEPCHFSGFNRGLERRRQST